MSEKTKAELQLEIDNERRISAACKSDRDYWKDQHTKCNAAWMAQCLSLNQAKRDLAEDEKTLLAADLALKTSDAMIHALESKYANAAGYREAIKDVLGIVPRARAAGANLAGLFAKLGDLFKK